MMHIEFIKAGGTATVDALHLHFADMYICALALLQAGVEALHATKAMCVVAVSATLV
jgi:hypothetical protein